MRILNLIFLLLAVTGSSHALADGARFDVAGLDIMRVFSTQRSPHEAGEQREQTARHTEPRRTRDGGLPESSGYGVSPDHGGAPESYRKQQRLSPEERRALRRQIDEVGHDIYSPRR